MKPDQGACRCRAGGMPEAVGLGLRLGAHTFVVRAEVELPKVPLQEVIRYVREQADMTQESLAEKVDLTAAYISLVERGKRKLSPAHAARIARVFGQSPKQYAWHALYEGDRNTYDALVEDEPIQEDIKGTELEADTSLKPLVELEERLMAIRATNPEGFKRLVDLLCSVVQEVNST